MFRMRILAVFIGLSGFVQTEPPVFTILTFNDVYDIVPDAAGRGGFAEMKTLLDRERARSSHHITTVNGDFLSPSLLSSLDKGAHRIDLFNRIGVDYVVLGNHEFDFGPGELQKRIAESRFPWLTANAIGLDGNYFTGEIQTVIFDVEGIKVGLFGLVTPETPNLSSTENKVCFPPLVYTARQVIADLKSRGAEVIIALTHLHTKEDRMLAEEVPEIDVILGGHDHDPETFYNDRTFIHKSGQNAWYLGRIDLTLEKNPETGQVRVLPSWCVILNRGISPDAETAIAVGKLQELLDTMTAEPVGPARMTFDTLYGNMRTKETAFGNFLADAVRSSTGADAVVLSGGLVRGNKRYVEGDVLTIRSLLTELPFQNSVVMVEMAGEDLLRVLENGVAKAEKKAGRFPQVSGLAFSYDPNRTPGDRVQSIVIEGEPLDLHRLYKVATVDYLLNGGDGYEAFKSGKILLSPLQNIGLVSVVTDYIRHTGGVFAPIEKRIVAEERKNTLDRVSETLR